MALSGDRAVTIDIVINYSCENRTLYLIKDDVGCTWYDYSGSFSVKVLPVYWQRP